MRFFSKTLDKLKGALRKTAVVLNTDVRTLFIPGRQINDAALAEWEGKFLQADMGVKNVQRMIGEIRESWRIGKIKNAGQAEQIVRNQILEILTRVPAADRELRLAPSGPTVILIAGINGAGKTTSIAKLAWILKNQMKKKVMVCASDTFRAAAVDQLTTWSQRIGVEIVKHKMGSDPAAVAYDACEAAKARNFDALIVDTAGRLHTQDHLMRELTKIRDVVAKRIGGAIVVVRENGEFETCRMVPVIGLPLAGESAPRRVAHHGNERVSAGIVGDLHQRHRVDPGIGVAPIRFEAFEVGFDRLLEQ